MSALISICNYGYFPTVIGLINFIVICVLFREQIKYFGLCMAAYLFFCVACVYLVSPVINFDYIDSLWPVPSFCELVIDTATWVMLALALRKTDLKKHWIVFLMLSLSYLLVAFLFGLGAILFDALMVYFVVIVIRFLKTTYSKAAFLFLIVCLMSALGFAHCNVTWRFLENDFRPDYITPFAKKRMQEQEYGHYYSFNCINDTEKRFCKVIENVEKVQDGANRFFFLEDTAAAYSFLRTSLSLSMYGADPIQYDEKKIGSLIVTKTNDLYSGKFAYRTSSISFETKSQEQDNIEIEGDFDDLTCNVFCSFQKYLETVDYDYVNKEIVLKNRNKKPKISLLYYPDNRYALKLLV